MNSSTYYSTAHSLNHNNIKSKSDCRTGRAEAVGNKMKSANVRDCVKIGRMAKSIEDVNFIVDAFQ